MKKPLKKAVYQFSIIEYVDAVFKKCIMYLALVIYIFLTDLQCNYFLKKYIIIILHLVF